MRKLFIKIIIALLVLSGVQIPAFALDNPLQYESELMDEQEYFDGSVYYVSGWRVVQYDFAEGKKSLLDLSFPKTNGSKIYIDDKNGVLYGGSNLVSEKPGKFAFVAYDLKEGKTIKSFDVNLDPSAIGYFDDGFVALDNFIYLSHNNIITQYDLEGNTVGEIVFEDASEIIVEGITPNGKALFIEKDDEYYYLLLDNNKLSNDKLYSVGYDTYASHFQSDFYEDGSIVAFRDGKIYEVTYSEYGLKFIPILNKTGYGIYKVDIYNNTVCYIQGNEIKVFNIDTGKFEKSYTFDENMAVRYVYQVGDDIHLIYTLKVGSGDIRTTSISLDEFEVLDTYAGVKVLNNHPALLRTKEETIKYYNENLDGLTYPESIYQEEPSLVSPYFEGTLKDEYVETYLSLINAYRYYAGMNELTLNKGQMETVARAAFINAVCYPNMLEGMDDNFFHQGSFGLGRSDYQIPSTSLNTDANKIVDFYLNDFEGTTAKGLNLFDPEATSLAVGIMDYEGFYQDVTSIYKEEINVEGLEEFYAYPIGYTPREIIDEDTKYFIELEEGYNIYDASITLTYKGKDYDVRGINYNNDHNGLVFALPEELFDEISISGVIHKECEITVTVENLYDENENEVLLTYPIEFVKAKKILIEDIDLNLPELDLSVGMSDTLSPVIYPDYADKEVYTWTSSNPEVATVDEYGYVRAIAPGKATITVTTSNGLTADCEVTVLKEMDFTDVSNKQWYFSYINKAYDLGLMTGATETLFKPNANMNRGMVAIVFHRMEGSEPIEYTPVFKDVPNKQYYTTSVLWMKSKGIINGYTDGTFKPLRNVSREEMATMIYNFAKYKGLDVKSEHNIKYFNDYNKITQYAKAPLQWAVENGLMSGKDNGTRLDPLGTATRAECAKMLVQAYKVIYNK